MTRTTLATSSSFLAFSVALLFGSSAAAQGTPITGTNAATPASGAEAQSTNPDAARNTNTPVVRTGDAQFAPADAAAPPNVNDAPSNATRAGTADVAEIVVTGSRIATAGYKQPTPVTVVNEATIQRDAKVSVGDTIRELPAVGASSSPNNGAGAGNIISAITGLDTINLRQLGINRTLVLIDGQRVVQSNITGGVDLGTIPQVLVQRIDVVTGGASAAWGSDAVAGVVNLVLNKNFDGIRLQAEGGEDYRWDHGSYRFHGAIGKGFADGRGRVILAGNYLNSPDIVFASQRSWNHQRDLVLNPAYAAGNGQPQYIHADNIGVYQATIGGLITGPLTYTSGGVTRPNPAYHLKFTGNGQTSPFAVNYVSGTTVSAGGDTDQLQSQINDLTVPYHTLTGFGYMSYELTDSIKASVQLNYGTTWSKNNSVPAVRLGNLTIPLDNAYLPASVKTAVAAAGGTSVQVGTTNMNNITSTDQFSLDNFVDNAVGIPVEITKRRLMRVVAALDGKVGSNFTWNAYYQRGEVRVRQDVLSNVVTAKYAFAIDAVDQGLYSNGVANGTIVCRATVQGKTTYNAAAAGCVPLNIFGTGVATKDAINYVNTRSDYDVIHLAQQTAAVSAQGKLPFGLAAGPVSVAFGAEYRTERGRTEADPGAIARLYSVGNFNTFFGKYNVKEAFLEAEVPILKDSFVDSLDFNAAGRITKYSTSGTVETWKAGATSQINPSVRVRGLVSRDIRAPNLNELFSTGVATLSSAVDPRQNVNVSIYTVASGNPNLKPEVAKTYSAGLVLSPTFVPRFNASLDFYSINIKQAIFSTNSTTVLARCNAGDTQFCPQLVFAGPAITSGANVGQASLSAINTYPLNISNQKTSGIDVQMDYTHALGAGSLQFRVLGNFVLTQVQNVLGMRTNYRGSIGNDSTVTGFPQARFTGSITYAQGPISFTAQTRFIGAAKLNNAWGPLDVDVNRIKPLAYVDLRGSYQINDHFQLYAAIDNLFQKAPPNVAVTPAQGQNAYYFTPVRGDIYDTVGGSFRVGVRAKF